MTKTRLYHTVAEQIKTQINEGVIPPGSRLPGERELAEQFGVSRVTIREAEIALQALGYINIKTGSGVYVLDPAENENLGLLNICAFELTEARMMFESEAAALTARHIDNQNLEHLEALIETIASNDPEDELASQQADREFHLVVAASSGNAAVKYVIETLWKIRAERSEVQDVHAAICRVEEAVHRREVHEKIVQALRARDSSASRQAMQEHFRWLLESMIHVTEEQAIRELRAKTTQSRQRYLNSTT